MHPPSFHTRSADQRRLEQVFHHYSLAKVLRHMLAGEPLDGFEADVESQFGGSAGTGNRQGSTITVPWGVLGARRDLNIASPLAGGYLVGNTMGPAGDVLRPYSVAARTGMTVLSGLRSDVYVPSFSEGLEFAWLTDETSAGPSLTPPTSIVQMRPHIACGVVTASDRLIRGVAPGVLDLMLGRFLRINAAALIDRVVLDGRSNRGTPVADDMAEPLGLCNTPGVVQYTGDISASTVLRDGFNAAMTAVASRAGSDEACSFIVHPVVRKYLLTGTDGYPPVLDPAGRLNGKALHVTSGMRADSGAYGEWSSAVLGLWGEGVEIALDPYSNFKTGAVSFRIMLALDCAFPNPGAFAVFNAAP